MEFEIVFRISWLVVHGTRLIVDKSMSSLPSRDNCLYRSAFYYHTVFFFHLLIDPRLACVRPHISFFSYCTRRPRSSKDNLKFMIDGSKHTADIHRINININNVPRIKERRVRSRRATQEKTTKEQWTSSFTP